MSLEKYHKVVFTNGTVMHYKGKQLHREDGPAIEPLSGPGTWFMHDKKLTDDEIANQQFVLWCTTPVKYNGD